jgi:ethylene-insensitive protein 3
VPPSFDLSGGVPEDGQKMIGELMSFYDSNVQGDKNANPNSLVTNGQNSLPKVAHQQDEYFRGQGVRLDGNFFEESNISSNHHVFPREEGQFDQFKVVSSPFETNHNNNFPMMFGSPFDLPSFDYKEDLQGLALPMEKQSETSIWFQ